MNLQRVSAAICTIAFLGFLYAPSANADAWNRKTVITFSGPVEIPGVHLKGWGVLPAGTYVFKIMDSQSNRHIVQIFNRDETIVYATILAIPNYRLQPTDKTVITFSERPAGEPEALRAWFYPGRSWGEEFVYPKARAVVLARTARQPVLSTPANLPVEVNEPVKVAESPIVAELKQAPVIAIQPNGEEAELEQVVTSPPAQELEAPAPATPELPATASPLPLISVLGSLALAGAVALRATASRLL
jgi:hypothetical protein